MAATPPASFGGPPPGSAPTSFGSFGAPPTTAPFGGFSSSSSNPSGFAQQSAQSMSFAFNSAPGVLASAPMAPAPQSFGVVSQGIDYQQTSRVVSKAMKMNKFK